MSHPSMDIIGEYSWTLKGKCIVVGITGSVAAYRSIDTARWLLRRGARVRVVMTRPAAELVTPKLLYWATGVEPVVELSGEVEHIEMARECDSMLVAPATLTTMSKIACGIGDNPVALTAISLKAEGKPVVIAPAMHGNMYSSHQYSQALTALTRMGYFIVPPKLERGVAKYHDPRLLARIVSSVTRRGSDLSGYKVLVTAGPTREWIDPVRYISNPSSGLMGVEVATEAYARGAEVTLVHGPLKVEAPPLFEEVPVDTTEDMAEAVGRLTSNREYDIIVAAAAPVDYKPATFEPRKIRSGGSLRLMLEPTPKVLESIARRPRVLVAFAAETASSLDELETLARNKMEKYGADIIVGNIVGVPDSGFSSVKERGVILARSGFKRVFDSMLKEELAELILDLARDLARGRG